MSWLKSDYFRIEIKKSVGAGINIVPLKSDYFRIEILEDISVGP